MTIIAGAVPRELRNQCPHQPSIVGNLRAANRRSGWGQIYAYQFRCPDPPEFAGAATVYWMFPDFASHFFFSPFARRGTARPEAVVIVCSTDRSMATRFRILKRNRAQRAFSIVALPQRDLKTAGKGVEGLAFISAFTGSVRPRSFAKPVKISAPAG